MYELGLVPNRLPYGFHHLLKQDFELELRAASNSWLIKKAIGGVGRRLSGGFEVVEALRGHARRSCDVAVCWNERTGVPAAARSLLPGEPKVVMGSIWMTDPHAAIPKPSFEFAKRALRRSAAIWANTDAQLDVLGGWGISPSRRHLLLNPGIDAKFWHCETSNPEYGLVMSVGNDRHRDHGYLLEIMRKVRNIVPESRLELITSRSICVPSDLGRRIPGLPHSELRTRYSRASVIAIALTPNIHVSGCTSILEAMACERPVVVTAYDGYERYVDHGITGYLVPPGDTWAFADAVSELISDPRRAKEMGQAGRAAVEERFSSEHFMTQLGGILRSVAN